MVRAFKSLSLVDHTCFCKLTQDLDPRIFPVGHSKMLRSLISTENQSVERSIIEKLERVKAVVISYDIWMSCKTEENFLLMAR